MKDKIKQTKTINWGAIKTNIIIAMTFSVLGIIGGYFFSINMHSQARQDVVRDLQVISKTHEQ